MGMGLSDDADTNQHVHCDEYTYRYIDQHAYQHANGNLYAYGDAYRNAYANANPNAYSNAYPDSYTNTLSHHGATDNKISPVFCPSRYLQTIPVHGCCLLHSYIKMCPKLMLLAVSLHCA
jgi:hypothetical protein